MSFCVRLCLPRGKERGAWRVHARIRVACGMRGMWCQRHVPQVRACARLIAQAVSRAPLEHAQVHALKAHALEARRRHLRRTRANSTCSDAACTCACTCTCTCACTSGACTLWRMHFDALVRALQGACTWCNPCACTSTSLAREEVEKRAARANAQLLHGRQVTRARIGRGASAWRTRKAWRRTTGVQAGQTRRHLRHAWPPRPSCVLRACRAPPCLGASPAAPCARWCCAPCACWRGASCTLRVGGAVRESEAGVLVCCSQDLGARAQVGGSVVWWGPKMHGCACLASRAHTQ